MAKHRGAAELSLAAACCRWPRDAGAISAIRQAADAPIDWPLFTSFIERYRIWALVRDGFDRAGVSVPETCLRTISRKTDRLAHENLVQAADAVRLQAAFDAAGIEVVFLKGIALAQLAYGSLTLKHGRDIDLFVRPADAAQAVRVLLHHGCTTDADTLAWLSGGQTHIPPEGRHIDMVCSTTGTLVELHTCADENPRLKAWQGNVCPTQMVEIAPGLALRTLQTTTLLYYLALHGGHHAWFRLKWLADFHALLARMTADEVADAFRRAVPLNADTALMSGLLLCSGLFGYRLPPSVAEAAPRLWRARMLSKISRAMMLYAPGRVFSEKMLLGPAFLNASQFLLGRGFSFFVWQCRVAAFSKFDRRMVRLPKPLWFLYPFLRPFLWMYRKALSVPSTPTHGKKRAG